MRNCEESIVVWGIGEDGKKFIEELNENVCVKYIIDNDSKKNGKNYKNIPILNFHSYSKIQDELRIVITSYKYKDEITRELIDDGFEKFIMSDRFLIEKSFQKNDGEKRIILLNTHVGRNIGDHLISIAETQFFEKMFEDYSLIEVSARLLSRERNYLKQFIKRNDIIAISGGGYMGSLWLGQGEENIRNAIIDYPENEIVVLPQTVYFENNEYGEVQKQISEKIYNSHRRLSICLRDNTSFNLSAKFLNNNVRKFLFPDMGLFIQESNKDRNIERNGVLLCFREDKEQAINPNIKSKIIEYCTCKGIVEKIDMIASNSFAKKNRVDEVYKIVRRIRNSKLVITDRLHCMIACTITGTPCIAFDNLSKKVGGTYEWIKGLDYIRYFESCEEYEDICSTVDRFLLNSDKYTYPREILYSHFENLAKIIRNEGK